MASKSKIERPWINENTERGWGELADFEHWLIKQLPEELQDVYENIDESLKTQLYVIFCNLCDNSI